jgi:hypothetical protein
MTTPTAKPSQQKPLPGGILDFIAAFMRSLNTARLYASGHDLFKKNIQDLYARLEGPLAERDFLFLGCARDAFFLEGEFFQAKDAHLKNFLKVFHSLGISHVLIDKKVNLEELESFIGLLAGAGQGQGDEVSAALPRENIRRISLGLLDYTIFSTVQTVAASLAQSSEDEAVWRQLIVQPAASAAFNLTPEKIKQLTGISEDADKLKETLLQLDNNMKEKQQGVTTMQRGIILGNLIQNLGNTLYAIDPKKRGPFPRIVETVLDTLESRLKTQIIGSVAPDPLMKEETGVIQEVFQAMENRQVIYLLYDALGQAGPRSPCFNNLFNRSLTRYGDPGLLLNLIREEMNRATQERKPGTLNHWQHLEQRLVQEQEAEELNNQYQNEIEALATSIQMEAPMVEDEEMNRLLRTMSPQALRTPKAYLIIDLLGRPRTHRSEAFVPSLFENLGDALGHLFREKKYQTVGNLLRDVFLALSDYPQEAMIRKILNSLFNTEDIRELLRSLLARCITYELRETTAVDAVCQLYPEKAGDFLIDMMLDLKEEDTPRAQWLATTLASLGPKLTRTLSRLLQDASDQNLPRLLDLAVLSQDPQIAAMVEPLLDHQNNDIREKAISTLGRLHAEKAVPGLAGILSQKSWLKGKKLKALQGAAVRALAEIGSDEARKVLRQVADEGSGELQALCRELL